MKKKVIFWILFFIIMCLSTAIYAKYIIADQMIVNISTSPFYFIANADTSNIEFDGEEAILNLSIANNNGELYTYSDIQYEINLESDAYKFSIENENVENNTLSKTLTGNAINNVTYKLKFALKAATEIISATENCTLKIKAKSPYVQEIAIPVTIKIVPDKIKVSIDKEKGVLEDINSTSTHIVTVKNDTSIPITYNISGSNTNELNLEGANQNIVVPANSEVATTLTITPTQNVYLSETSTIEIKTNIIAPYEYEIATQKIKLETWASPMKKIITEKYTINQGTPNFTENITTETGSGVFQTDDASGIAQYFRGVSTNNYVQFANNLWRIMRVNGDGTVRLILDNPINSNTAYSYTNAITNSEYNDGPAEIALETWYKENLLSYNSYVNQNALFIHDRREATTNSEVYRGWERLLNSTPTINTTGLSYLQKYSVNTLGNGFLTYPIALPTADEIMMAGAVITPDSTITTPNASTAKENYSFYMANNVPSGVGLWTLTPFSTENVMCFKTQGGFYNEAPTNAKLLKPVIELNANIEYKGTGTKADPFIICE